MGRWSSPAIVSPFGMVQSPDTSLTVRWPRVQWSQDLPESEHISSGPPLLLSLILQIAPYIQSLFYLEIIHSHHHQI